MNVVWIIIDSLRADHLGCYGYPRPTSPNIDRLARESLRFAHCITPHIPTHPAHTTMFTGRDVFDHQIVAQGGRVELDPGCRLVPSLLRDRGYFTGAVDNIGRWIAPAFDRYEEYPRWNHDGTRPWRNGEEVTRRAVSVLEEASARQPFFLFVHYWDPHTPYLPPPPFDRMFYDGDEKHPSHRSMDPVWESPWFRNYFKEWLPGVRDREFVRSQYDASIAYTDSCLAPLLEQLERPELADTLLIVGADHGEELDEHGCWFDHHGLYETNVRVPLLIRPPGGAGGVVREEQVTLLDAAPTVLAAAGAPSLAEENGMRGRSLLQPGTPGSPSPVYLSECTWMRKRAWRSWPWKLIEALEEDIYSKPPVELYDLQSDPGETVNLAAERPEVVERLLSGMHEWVERRMRETGRPDPLVDQADALRTWQPRFIAGRAG